MKTNPRNKPFIVSADVSAQKPLGQSCLLTLNMAFVLAGPFMLLKDKLRHIENFECIEQKLIGMELCQTGSG